MDNLATCMICEEEFEESQSVVVVSDATSIGYAWSDDVVSFEEDDAPYRAVYCTECWDSLVVYSWELSKAKGESNE